MIVTMQRLVLATLAMLISGLAQGGPLVIDDGDTFVVLPGDKLATGDVVVNGTFRNQGSVTHSGAFANFHLTDNQGTFTNLGKFGNFGSFENSGLFVNTGSFVNDNFAFLTSGGAFNSTGYLENRWYAWFSELNVEGTLDNHGELTTAAGTHHLNGTLANTGQWYNSGHIRLGQPGVAGTTLTNSGEMVTNAVLAVTAGSALLNTGTLTNRDDMVVDGRLVNYGDLINDGALEINDNGARGAVQIDNTGTITNTRTLTVNRSQFDAQGNWINRSVMQLNVDTVTVNGQLLNEQRLFVTGDVEVAAGGTLEHAGTLVDIAGGLVNRGTTVARLTELEAERIENHGVLAVDALLITGEFVQHEGSTVFSSPSNYGGLVASSIQIHGGVFAADANNAFIDGVPGGPDPLVEMFGGTIGAGAGHFAIEGGLVLHDDASMVATLRDDEGVTRTGKISLTQDLILAGTLAIDIGPGALVSPGDVWTLASALSISGMFDTIELPAVAGIDFELLVRNVGLPGVGFQELVLSAQKAVPLPAPLVLFLSAAGALAGLRRRSG